MLTINGSAAPTPSSLRVTLAEIGGAEERSASGGAVLDFIGTRRRLKLRWAHLGAPALRALLDAVDGDFFEVAYPDPMTGGTRTASFWCANRSMGVLRVANGAPLWTDIAMEWMER